MLKINTHTQTDTPHVCIWCVRMEPPTLAFSSRRGKMREGFSVGALAEYNGCRVYSNAIRRTLVAYHHATNRKMICL